MRTESTDEKKGGVVKSQQVKNYLFLSNYVVVPFSLERNLIDIDVVGTWQQGSGLDGDGKDVSRGQIKWPSTSS